MMKKRVFSLFMVVMMVCSLAVGCGGKKDEDVQEGQKKAEASDDETKKKEEEAAPEESAGAKVSEEVNEYGITDSQLKDLYATIESTMIEEYIEPNNIQDFQWPTDEEFWDNCDQMLAKYGTFSELQSMDLENPDMEISEEEVEFYKKLKENEPTVDELYTTDENKAIISSIYSGVKKWTEKNKIDFMNFNLWLFSCQEEFSENIFVK